jgi:hypothetical protein
MRLQRSTVDVPEAILLLLFTVGLVVLGAILGQWFGE